MKQQFTREEKIKYYQGVKAYLLKEMNYARAALREAELHEDYPRGQRAVKGIETMGTLILKIDAKLAYLRTDSRGIKRQA